MLLVICDQLVCVRRQPTWDQSAPFLSTPLFLNIDTNYATIDALDTPIKETESSNTQVWLAAEQPLETIESFNFSNEKIDLSDLISLDNKSDLDDYLSISSESRGTKISESIGGGNELDQTAIFDGVNTSEQLQSSQKSVINKLFTNLGNDALMTPSSASDESTHNSQRLLDDDNITDL